MSLSFLRDEVNADFLGDLGTRWKVEFDKETYALINPSTEAITQQKSISAILQFFVDFGGHFMQDEATDESRTALAAYVDLFQNTGYTVHLVDSFPAATLNYQKNQSKTERFHYYNERYRAEFIVSGPNVYLYQKIGAYKPDVRIDEDLNVKSATVEIDDASFWTWCKCYYDKLDDSEGVEEEYREETVFRDEGLIEKYGEIEGPALYQGNIRYQNVMMDFAKSSQEESLKVSHSVDMVDLKRQGYDEFIYEPGDTVLLSLSSIDITVDIRIMEINEQFVMDEYGEPELVDFTLTLGNYDPVKTSKQSRNAVMIDLQDWIHGRREMPESILPPAIQRASDIVIGDTDSVMEYRKDRLVGHHDKNAGNSVEMNVSGLIFNRNGEPKTAMTHEGIVADAVTTGTLNANNVVIYGEDGDKYMYMTGSQLISHGEFKRTWAGVTDTAELNLGIYNGRIMISNEETGYNLYMTEKGLSTTMSGAIEDFTAGTIEFHSQRYNDNSRGVTVHSTYGAVALESDYSTIYSVSNLTNNIESREYSVYVRPFRDTRNGLNEFQFYVKDNESSSETDGALLFGNLTGGATHGSGVRLSKSGSDPKVYATNVNGDIGTGGFHGKYVQAESIRVLDEGANFYLGTSTGEVRVTNNLLYNGGDVGYRPIKASAFTQASSEEYKTNIEKVEDIGLETIMDLKVVEYDLIDDIEAGITDNRQIGLVAEDSAPVATRDLTGIDLYKMSSYSIKAIQELESRIKSLEAS